MAIEDWTDPVECGDDEVAQCPELNQVVEGLRPLVAASDNCPDELISSEYPGIVQAISSNKTQIRSGSTVSPIQTPLMRERSGLTAPTLLGQDNDTAGKQYKWNPGEDCRQLKMIRKDNLFQLVPDENSNIFGDSCIGTEDEIDYLVGAKIFTDCKGETKVRLIMYPASGEVT